MPERIRTRFAPSPTGSLHVGNARIAVLNWLVARHHNGVFVVRIEDTDEGRTVAGAEAGILEDLAWLGLDWDEGPDTDGPYGPYRQSERGGLYHERAARLVESGAAFPCFCTPEEIETKRKSAIARGEQPHYDGTCRGLSDEQKAGLEREGRTPAIRFRVPDSGQVDVPDVVRGSVRFDAAELGDFIILRADGEPTYNFAVTVDDAAMEITHVIRGVGHLSNTPKQVLLYSALEHDPPVFAHAPTILGPDRHKLSKRRGARPLTDYRREGWHADAVVNYLSLLSWSSPSGDEFLQRKRLVNEISLDRVRPADAVFDPEKMAWLSARHIEGMSLDALVKAVEPYIDRDRFPIPDERVPSTVAAVRNRISTFSEINEHLEPFVAVLDAAGVAARDALLTDDRAQAVIAAAKTELESLKNWDDESLMLQAIRSAGKSAGVKGASLYIPIRIALTGDEHGPPLPAVLHAQGREGALRLLDQALAGPSD